MMVFGSQRGNLVTNGSFEMGLAGWDGISNVGLQALTGAHQGLVAAAMGKPDNTLSASMYQDVPVVPATAYKLQVFVAGIALAPADLSIDVRWLDRLGVDLGTALTPSGPLTVPAATTGASGAGSYKAVIAYTGRAPIPAVSARILLGKAPGAVATNFLLVDDVTFSEVT